MYLFIYVASMDKDRLLLKKSLIQQFRKSNRKTEDFDPKYYSFESPLNIVIIITIFVQLIKLFEYNSKRFFFSSMKKFIYNYIIVTAQCKKYFRS